MSATAVLVVNPAITPAASGPLEVNAGVAPGELSYGAALTVSGRVTSAGQSAASLPLALQADPYPFDGYATVARLASLPDGSFAFTGITPDRDTRLRVIVEGQPGAASRELPVTVDPAAALSARSLGLGRTLLSVRVRHSPRGESPPVSAWWFVAARGSHIFGLAAVTSTRELARGLTYASATIDPPSRRFAFRVCMNPAWERAMGAPSTHGSCPRHAFAAPAQ